MTETVGISIYYRTLTKTVCNGPCSENVNSPLPQTPTPTKFIPFYFCRKVTPTGWSVQFITVLLRKFFEVWTRPGRFPDGRTIKSDVNTRQSKVTMTLRTLTPCPYSILFLD